MIYCLFYNQDKFVYKSIMVLDSISEDACYTLQNVTQVFLNHNFLENMELEGSSKN